MSAAVKQVQTGDTNITFAIGQGSMTPEQRLDSLIAYLRTRGKVILYVIGKSSGSC